MENFKIDEVLGIKPVSEDSLLKRELYKKRKKKKETETDNKSEKVEKESQEKHIDIYA